MSRLSLVVFTAALTAVLVGPARAQDQDARSAPAEKAAGSASKVIPVWPDGAPGSEGWTQKEVQYRNEWDHKAMVRNVTTPALTAFLPDPSAATGAAIVICPGGGFRFLSWQSEGTEVAEWLRARGGRGVRAQVPAHGDPGVGGGVPQGDGGVPRRTGASPGAGGR